MLASRGSVGGAPGHVLPCGGAGGVGNSKMAERKHTRHVILWSPFCNTRRNSDGLDWARGEDSVTAVPPLVGHHRAVAIHHGGAPGDGGGGVGAFVVLHT